MQFFSLAYFSEVFLGLDVPIGNVYNQPIRGGFYKSSQVFTPLAEFMHVPLDQINYVVSGVISFALGQLMRRRLSPQKYSPRLRALFELLFGLLLLSFCFGYQLRVLLVQSSIAYLFMVCLPRNHFMAVLVTSWSLFFLTLVHICRLKYDYGGYTLDISGPVMVQTQRLSSLAFNLVDGVLIKKISSSHHDKPQQTNCFNNNETYCETTIEQLPINSPRRRRNTFTAHDIARPTSTTVTPNSNVDTIQYHNPNHYKQMPQQHDAVSDNNSSVLVNMPTSHQLHAVDKIPDPIIFFAYMLYFHGVFVGPFTFFSEYMDYLKGYANRELPPVNMPSGLSAAYLCPYFPFEFVLAEAFGSYSILHRILYVTISLFLIRQKYYFAWGLAEVNGVAIGAGYTGRCPRTGDTLNHHIRNFDFLQVETGVSLKNVIDAWNISTTRWLRETFYDRLPVAYRTLLVFIISAFWHGFYPGYYIMFLSFALFTMASRIWRRQCRQYFRNTLYSIQMYNISTMIITNLIVNYGQAPFHLLDFYASLKFLRAFYFIPHIIASGIVFVYFFKLYILKSFKSYQVNIGKKFDYFNTNNNDVKHQKSSSSSHDRSIGGH
ncbi:Membrane-bound O-acyltransferase domain-containing protein [Schistosoma japonicum]|uniref:Membrane-bound O-acyltransferase domain-containing protein n=1 Tax=Schistosoma japonicum TaxID=6182 RepID=A0A4Z2DIW5_SCHJA|nr:Membrane-bound O-acyltransferase domain-containing protein [Schistosoma japonicum]